MIRLVISILPSLLFGSHFTLIHKYLNSVLKSSLGLSPSAFYLLKDNFLLRKTFIFHKNVSFFVKFVIDHLTSMILRSWILLSIVYRELIVFTIKIMHKLSIKMFWNALVHSVTNYSCYYLPIMLINTYVCSY